MLLGLTVALALTALPTRGDLTFARALELADAQGPELLAERLATRTSAAGIEAASALPNPLANFRTGGGDPATTASLELRLPYLGQYQSGVAAARAEAEAAGAKLAWTRHKLRAEVRRAYFALAEAQAQHALSLHLTALAEELARVVREQVAVGSAPRLDAEQSLLAAQRKALEATDREAEVEATRAALSVLLGLPPGPSVRAADPLEIPDAPAAIPGASAETHPEATLAQRTQHAAEARAHEARMAAIPVPWAGLELEGRLAPTFEVQAVRGGLTVDLPLFSWNGGSIHQAALTARQREVERRAVLNRVAITLATSRRRFELARQRALIFQETIVPASPAGSRRSRALHMRWGRRHSSTSSRLNRTWPRTSRRPSRR